MIVVDASVVSAFLNPEDVHHDRSTFLLTGLIDQLTMNPVNRAEALALWAANGVTDEADGYIDQMDISTTPMAEDAHRTLAELRQATRLKMPDCCVLLTARQVSGGICTFDDTLAKRARELGIEVLAA